MDGDADLVIEMRGVGTRFGRHVVHEGLDLEVRRGEILAIAGGSGSGKTVLMRVMFQRGGLFSALSVRDNVGLPLREHSALDRETIAAIAEWKIVQTGLPTDALWMRPGELSGGMLKRAALARALAL